MDQSGSCFQFIVFFLSCRIIFERDWCHIGSFVSNKICIPKWTEIEAGLRGACNLAGKYSSAFSQLVWQSLNNYDYKVKQPILEDGFASSILSAQNGCLFTSAFWNYR